MGADTRRRYVHEDPAFAIDMPVDADLGTTAGMLVVARAPEGLTASPFRSNLTIVAQDLPGDVDHAELAEQSLAEEARALPNWRLIDRATETVGELPAERTLATYIVGRGSGVDFGRDLSVTVQQWRIVEGTRQWITSASCETPEFALVGDLWADSAVTLRLGAPAS
jgi:hypothetical protein